MIEYKYFLYTIGSILHDNFEEYDLLNEINEEDITKPSFYVEVRPLTQKDYLSYVRKTVNISVTYINSVVSNMEKLDIKSKLDSAFDIGIYVNGTFILFENKQYSTGDILTLNFTLNYFDNKDKILDPAEDYDSLIENLYLNLNKVKGVIK